MLGDTGFGRYELVERLAVRAASELFVVKVSGEHGFKRHIVLKRLRDDALATTFIEDAKLSAKLSHAKIVQTLELGRIGDVPYVATDYVDGVDLLGFMRELARQRRALDPAIATWIAQELLDALDYAHTFVDEGHALPIVHGRLSPAKVLLGDGGEVKLCDFGIARRFDLVHGGQDYGHMSPEQVMELPVDSRSDVFGVGVLLAEMLMRRRLFVAHNEFDVLLMVRDVRTQRFEEDAKSIDGELAGIVRKAIEKKPDDRYPTAAAFRDALDAWLFARRKHGMNQQLAVLVEEFRPEIDAWRRSGETTTPELDDLRETTGPVSTDRWARGSAAPQVKTVAIPPVDSPRGSTSMKPVKRPTPPGVPIAVEDRPSARGTVEPKTSEDARSIESIPPLRKPEPTPKNPIPTTSAGRAKHPHVILRGSAAKPGAIGMGLQDLLPARTPTQQREQPTLLTAEQLAKAGQPPPPKLATVERSPDGGGDFARTPPLRVVFHLMRARSTGLLQVTLDSVRKDVYMRDGQVAGVWSNDKTDLFGNYLVAQKVLSDGELAMALATMSHYGGKIGDTLVGLNLMSHVDVFRHLTRHARTKVVDICTWSAGTYAWYAGSEDPREGFPVEAEGFQMLGEAALAMPSGTIDQWLAKNREERVVAVKGQRVTPEVFALRGAAEVFAWVDGMRNLGAIVESHADRGRVARLLYLFVACDLIRHA